MLTNVLVATRAPEAVCESWVVKPLNFINNSAKSVLPSILHRAGRKKTTVLEFVRFASNGIHITYIRQVKTVAFDSKEKTGQTHLAMSDGVCLALLVAFVLAPICRSRTVRGSEP